jgi:hypothetical protein
MREELICHGLIFDEERSKTIICLKGKTEIVSMSLENMIVRTHVSSDIMPL